MIRLLQDLTGWRRGLVALLAGAVAALALPPVDLWPLLFLAVPAFLMVLGSVTSMRARFLLGWLFGLGYFIVALHWIGAAFFVDAATYLWMMPFAVGGLAAVAALYWGLAAALTGLIATRGLPQVLGFAAMLAVAEDLRGRLFTGFPWAVPGLAVDGMGPLAQTASLIGMTGLTLLIVLWAGLPLVLFETGAWRQRLAALGLLALMPLGLTFGMMRLAEPMGTDVAGVKLRLVQPNISQDEKWRADNARSIFDTLKTLSAEPGADGRPGIDSGAVVIWPESAVPFLIDESPVAKEELSRLLAGKATLITGAIRRDANKKDSDGEPLVYNSMITFNGAAQVVARYDKWRLVPGGEFLPFAWLLEPLGFRKVVIVPGSFATGPGPVTITVPGAPDAAMLICYEAIFPHDLIEPGKRPGWIINVTNDGWFGRSAGPYQHLAQARLRTIEQGLPVVRVANTGISAVIDSRGKILQSLAVGRQGVIDSGLPPAGEPTIYSRFGDWGLAGLVLLALAGAMPGRRRKRFG
ncbi:MAG: apolipoprotein N-acyltransferase [Rhizobiales bacterium]|nr:apolipoprotein N-acyltransferase [Hyphomicrobiales bacterium]MBI3672528.1 apolipoprotein N-acyltransferase [Hyphomicrobiales bacterium]